MKGHNSAKNHRTGTKFELDLYLIMVNLYTKYHINTSKHNEKKCGKLFRTDGRTTDGRSGATTRPALADGNAGKNNFFQNFTPIVLSFFKLRK